MNEQNKDSDSQVVGQIGEEDQKDGSAVV